MLISNNYNEPKNIYFNIMFAHNFLFFIFLFRLFFYILYIYLLSSFAFDLLTHTHIHTNITSNQTKTKIKRIAIKKNIATIDFRKQLTNYVNRSPTAAVIIHRYQYRIQAVAIQEPDHQQHHYMIDRCRL